MALYTKQLSLLAYANLFSIWTYKTSDNLNFEVGNVDEGYFNECWTILNEGDWIIANQYEDVEHNKGLKSQKTFVVLKVEKEKVSLGVRC